MGNFVSSASSYIDVYKFNTFAEIDMQQEMLRQFEVSKAAGQQQMLAQVANVGGLGGGGGYWSAMTPWGNTSSIWLGANNFFQTIGPPLAVVFTIFTVIGIFARLPPGAIFGGMFATMFFAMMWIMYHTFLGMQYITTPRLLMSSIVVGITAGAGLVLAWYKPLYDSEKAQEKSGEKKTLGGLSAPRLSGRT